MMNETLMDKIEKRMGILLLIGAILGFAFLGFAVWIIIKLLAFWGVI